MKTMKYHIIYAACVLCAMSVTGCTDKFEQYNTNPAAPTEEQIVAMAESCINACGGPKGSAKLLDLDDMINIYRMANR